MSKTITLSDATYKNLQLLIASKGLRAREAIDYLIGYYQLEHIEEIIRVIKTKHINIELTPSQKAGLSILRDYLDSISG
jgi:hypothetical protein